MTEGTAAHYGYTFCDGCNEVPFCGIRFTREGDVVTKVESWPGYPAGPICSKGYATLQRLYHPDRLLYPMRRTNPKGPGNPGFVRITWDEAYDAIAAHLQRIKVQSGPESVFFYVGEPKEPRAAVQRLAVTYGSPNYGCESSTACRRAAQLAEMLTYGFPTTGNLPSADTKVMLIWGTNPAYSGQPYMCHGALADAKARGVKFIVIDPRNTPMVGTLADIHLAPRPGTDAALAAGMMHVIFKEGLEDKDFCRDWVHGLEELKAYVADFPPERVEDLTWVPAEKIVEAAGYMPQLVRVDCSPDPRGPPTHERHQQSPGASDGAGRLRLYRHTGRHREALQPVGGLRRHWADGPPSFTLRQKLLEMRDRRLDLHEYPAWAEFLFEVMTSSLVEWIKEARSRRSLGWASTP
jgi:anaerobic selenocysteine-containing dehydrogenase